MKLQNRRPCNECPWRLNAPRGWLGGHPPEMYADAVMNNEVPACHQKDFGPNDGRTAMCAGALAVAANTTKSVYKTSGGDAARKEVGKRDDCFNNVRAFYQYHTGKVYVAYLQRQIAVIVKEQRNG